MYTQADFVERFRALENYELLDRLATSQLTDEARAAMQAVLGERGVSESELPTLLVQAKKDRYRRTGVTNDCDYCGKSSGVSPVRDGGQIFCGIDCCRTMRILEAAADFDDDDVHRHALALRSGPCPSCQRQGSPVEVRRSYHVWSALFYTRWGSTFKVRCRPCGMRQNLADAGFSATLGWWAFPLGLVLTPVQILRNIGQILARERTGAPSSELLEMARRDLGYRALQQRLGDSGDWLGPLYDDAAQALPISAR